MDDGNTLGLNIIRASSLIKDLIFVLEMYFLQNIDKLRYFESDSFVLRYVSLVMSL